MLIDYLLRAPAALLPVITFLGVLMLLDSFRLLRLSAVSGAMAVGGVVAGLSYLLNGLLTWPGPAPGAAARARSQEPADD